MNNLKHARNRIINAPVSCESIADLRAGDVVYFSGRLFTGRDDVYRRIVDEGYDCPVSLKDMAMYHAGPIVREKNGAYELVSVGPTSSIRMEAWAADFIKKTGIRIMIGKGGMGEKTAEACREFGAIHCVYPGGCAVLGAGQIETVEDVYWRELGMPESLWVMRARETGPLIVSIDTQGNNLFAENAAHYMSQKESCIAPVIKYLRH